MYLNNSALTLISMDCMFSAYPSVQHKESKNCFYLAAGTRVARPNKPSILARSHLAGGLCW